MVLRRLAQFSGKWDKRLKGRQAASTSCGTPRPSGGARSCLSTKRRTASARRLPIWSPCRLGTSCVRRAALPARRRCPKRRKRFGASRCQLLSDAARPPWRAGVGQRAAAARAHTRRAADNEHPLDLRLAATQDLADFCAEHQVVPDCERANVGEIDTAFERKQAHDVNIASYRHGVDEPEQNAARPFSSARRVQVKRDSFSAAPARLRLRE
ncbi:hypothetical protein BURKHO8Y_10473 [Burkholderia sp. 8Y]|nr:hypothetical protein BURKHO8Y_10473 [Burkholderia sp. 8Y]